MMRRPILAALACGLVAVCVFPRDVTGTIEEQRARLPPPAECSDPVEGVWMGLRYTEWRNEWYEFTMDIRRVTPGSDELRGEILSHFWEGGAKDQKPPPCKPGGMEQYVKMPGHGKVSDDNGKSRVAFGANTYTVEKIVCGPRGLYAPDNFSGTIDPERQEFQSVNNDGASSVNEPNVFRRIRCFDPPRKQAALDVRPPGYAPLKKTGGCGL